jgi:general secretion pathway protein M
MNARDLWRSRAPRERAVLAAGGAVIAVMLAVALVWLPLERTRVRLEREVPELRAAVQALQRDAEEAKRLRSMAPVAAQSAAPLAALAAGAVAAPPGSRLVLVDPGHLRLTGADVGFTQLLEWLASAAGNHGLRVESAHVEALAAPGRVRVDITLART